MTKSKLVDLGFHTADIEDFEVRYTEEALTLSFFQIDVDSDKNTYSKHKVDLICENPFAYKFQCLEECNDGEDPWGTYLVEESDWVKAHDAEIGKKEVSHYRLFLNGIGMFEVICSELRKKE